VYDQNNCGSSSKGNLQIISENDPTSFGESSEFFGTWLEIFGKLPKTQSPACLYNKKIITLKLEDMNFMFW